MGWSQSGQWSLDRSKFHGRCPPAGVKVVNNLRAPSRKNAHLVRFIAKEMYLLKLFVFYMAETICLVPTIWEYVK